MDGKHSCAERARRGAVWIWVRAERAALADPDFFVRGKLHPRDATLGVELFRGGGGRARNVGWPFPNRRSPCDLLIAAKLVVVVGDRAQNQI